MKFKIKVKHKGGDEWWEEYDEKVEDAHIWARDIIKRFNETLRPYEPPRELLRVEIIDDNNKKFHNWIKRTYGMSVKFRGATVDLMYCSRCGITGKRYGFYSNVKIDSKFRKKAYKECHTAQIEIRR